jgi:hypothetical protein
MLPFITRSTRRGRQAVRPCGALSSAAGLVQAREDCRCDVRGLAPRARRRQSLQQAEHAPQAGEDATAFRTFAGVPLDPSPRPRRKLTV